MRSLRSLTAVVVCAGILAACGGGGSSEQPSNSSRPAQSANSTAESDADVVGALSKSMSVVNQVAPQESRRDNARATRTYDSDMSRDVSLSCEEGGTAEISGTGSINATPGLLEIALHFQIDFGECSGYSGSITASGGATAQNGIIDQNLTINGTLVDSSCSYTFTQLREQAIIDRNAVTHSAVINGQAKAVCGAITTICIWNNVSLSNTTALEQSCRPTVAP